MSANPLRDEVRRILPILERLEDSPLWHEFSVGTGVASLNALREHLAASKPEPKPHDFKEWFGGGLAASPNCGSCGRLRNDPVHAASKPEPVDMVLYCPKCGTQHIDGPDYRTAQDEGEEWTNPPHKSHLCASCGHIWRPSDTPTNGVQRTASGKDADTAPIAGGGQVCGACGKPWYGEKCAQVLNDWQFPVCYPVTCPHQQGEDK